MCVIELFCLEFQVHFNINENQVDSSIQPSGRQKPLIKL